MKFKIFLYILIISNTFLIDSVIGLENTTKENNFKVYDYKDSILYGKNKDISILISVKFDLDNKRFRLVIREGTGELKLNHLLSFGNIKQDSSNILMIDKTNSIIFKGYILNESLSFISGIDYLKNKIYNDRTSNYNKRTADLIFPEWNNNFGDNVLFNKIQHFDRIDNGDYISDTSHNFIKIHIQDNLYNITCVTLFANIEFPISHGSYFFNERKIIFKDSDNINSFEAYYNDNTIQPVNHLPLMQKNPPLILQKKE